MGDGLRRLDDDRLPRSQAKREALALEIGADGFQRLDAWAAPAAPAAARTAARVWTLRQVWQIPYKRNNGRRRWRTVAELPPSGARLPSPDDPEMHPSLKRQVGGSGPKVPVTETCDEDAAHLVTQVATGPARPPDMAATAGSHERLAAKGLRPAEPVGNSASVDAALLVGRHGPHGVAPEGEVARRGELAGPWPRHGCDLPHVTIARAHERVTCPEGKVSGSGRPARNTDGSPRLRGPGLVPPDQDAAPPCHLPPARGARGARPWHGRGWPIPPGRRAMRSGRGWRARCRRASAPQGMRRSRTIGLAKTGLQQACIATAMNVARIADWIDGRPRAITRVTRFAALASAA